MARGQTHGDESNEISQRAVSNLRERAKKDDPLLTEVILPTQLVYQEEKPDPALVTEIKNRLMHYKPYGGFWTATMDEYGESSWGDMISEDQKKANKRWQLEMKKPARIIVIDSPEKEELVVEKYRRTEPLHETEKLIFDQPELFSKSLGKMIDWEKLSKDYDGVRFDREHENFDGRPDWEYMDSAFYTWDIESTLWFTWPFSEAKEVTD